MAQAPQGVSTNVRGIGSLLLFLGLILLTATVSIGSYVWKSDLPARVADCERAT